MSEKVDMNSLTIFLKSYPVIYMLVYTLCQMNVCILWKNVLKAYFLQTFVTDDTPRVNRNVEVFRNIVFTLAILQNNL